MCPNHPEHTIDRRLLPEEFGISDRMLLWDKYAPREISEHSIKMGFLRNLQRPKPPFRLQRKVDLRPKKVKVPASIKGEFHDQADAKWIVIRGP
jgi:hypothetical protein